MALLKNFWYLTKNEIKQLLDEINTTDKEIDLMVYELYELTGEEIGIVDNSEK